MQRPHCSPGPQQKAEALPLLSEQGCGIWARRAARPEAARPSPKRSGWRCSRESPLHREHPSTGHSLAKKHKKSPKPHRAWPENANSPPPSASSPDFYILWVLTELMPPPAGAQCRERAGPHAACAPHAGAAHTHALSQRASSAAVKLSSATLWLPPAFPPASAL